MRPVLSAAEATSSSSIASLMCCEPEHVTRTPPGGEQSERAEVDLFIAARGAFYGRPRFRECRRIEHDHIEALTRMRRRCEKVKGVGLWKSMFEMPFRRAFRRAVSSACSENL